MSDDLREQFGRDGFVIVRDVVPAADLAPLRETADGLIDRYGDGDGDDPGSTRVSPIPKKGQPTDPDVVRFLNFALHDNTYGLSARLMDAASDRIMLILFSILHNPRQEGEEPQLPGQSWGTDPRNWHRDVRPDHDGPLSEILTDAGANGPGYVQWNIALYEDSILEVVPGSHRRLQSEAEMSQFESGGTQTVLADGLRVELNPGDGVVYNNVFLHRGTQYTPDITRRTIHIGYRMFDRMLPHQNGTALPRHIREQYADGASQRRVIERFDVLYGEEFDLIERIFRAVIERDGEALGGGLDQLHPNEVGRLSCLIVLSKLAQKVHGMHEQGIDSAELACGYRTMSEQRLCDLATRLSRADVERLWAGFGALDRMIRSGQEGHTRGFLGPPTGYVYEQLPNTITAERVVEAMLQ